MTKPEFKNRLLLNLEWHTVRTPGRISPVSFILGVFYFGCLLFWVSVFRSVCRFEAFVVQHIPRQVVAMEHRSTSER
jgi:hypothetical protein